MFPLAHVGITLFVAALLSLPLSYALIGSLLPDLIDKPLKILGVAPCGRFIGHTLFGGIVAFIISYLWKRDKKISFTLLFTYYLHLLEDIPFFMPWFYPFKNYNFPTGPWIIKYTLYGLITDSIGLSLLIYTFYFNNFGRDYMLKIFNDFKVKMNGRKTRLE